MTFRPASRLVCAACFALGLALPGIAHAEDDGTVEMARQRFREGVGFYDQRQYEKARLAFLQAYALKPHPSILMNLAQSELRGGRPGDAATHFTEYLRGNTEASEAERQEAELGLAAAKSKVSEVTIAVDAAGAQISVDGEEKGTAPLPGPIYLTAGAHTIDARSGDRHASKSIMLTTGQASTASLSLRAAATAPPVAAATSGGGGDAEKPDAEPSEEAAPAKEQPAEPSESAEPSAKSGGRKQFFAWWVDSPVAIGGTIVGAGLLGTGITFGLLSHKDYNTADSLSSAIHSAWYDGTLATSTMAAVPPDGKNFPSSVKPCDIDKITSLGPQRVAQYSDACSKFQDAANSGDSKQTIAIITSIAGGVVLAGTVVYYFLDPHAEEKSAAARRTFRARLIPLTGGGTSGLGVVGQF